MSSRSPPESPDHIDAMAQLVQEISSSPFDETPSPSAAETSGNGRPVDVSDDRPRTRSRPRRSPSRLELRTAFRNFSGVVEVYVGDPNEKVRPQTKFLVHKELLISASPFFAAALGGTFAEGLEQCVRLPEEKPEIFEWFLQWLYTGSLTTPVNKLTPLVGRVTDGTTNSQHPMEVLAEADGCLRNSAGSPKYFLLIDLWALSDRMLAVQLSNHIVTAIARLSHATNSVPTPSDTWMLYDTVRDSALIRTLILDLFAYKKTDKLLETHKDEWHPRFLRDLVVKLKRPGLEAVERHDLIAWRPRSWSTTRACEGCKETLKPGLSYDKCSACTKAFCGNCLRTCGEPNGFTDTSGCKPWMGKNMCLRYHEHDNGEVCF